MYVSDDSGYQVKDDDLAFLSLTPADVKAMTDHQIPLGMNAAEFEHFRDTLAIAATRDGIDDFEARLQGSSAKFFAGAHKEMAYERASVVDEFEAARQRLPEVLELRQIFDRMRAVWPDPADRPKRRPFDAYYKLGIERHGSDYDIQISSDELALRAREKLDQLELGDEYEMRHPTYRFIKKSIVYYIAPNLTNWATLESDILGRKVTLAVFPGCGPERITDRPEISSHHRVTDWILLEGSGRD